MGAAAFLEELLDADVEQMRPVLLQACVYTHTRPRTHSHTLCMLETCTRTCTCTCTCTCTFARARCVYEVHTLPILALQKYEVYKRKKAVLPIILHGLRGWIAVRRFRVRLAEARAREAEAQEEREAKRAREAGARARAEVEAGARAAAEWARRKEAAHTLRRVDATLFALKQGEGLAAVLQAAGGAAGLLLMAATFDGSATVQTGFAQAAAQLCLASARARWAGGGEALEVGRQLKAAGAAQASSK